MPGYNGLMVPAHNTERFPLICSNIVLYFVHCHIFLGKSLGLVIPTLPEVWGGQLDRSSPRAKECLMECINILTEAGCDVNQLSTIFGKTFR